MASQTIDQALNEKILAQISWRHGILPSGDIADGPGFVFQEMPEIKICAELETTQHMLVTQSDWTAQFVSSGVIWNFHDDLTLRALSDCQLIFHQLERPMQKTLHLLHYDTVAWFRMRDVYGPTIKLKKALDDVFQHWPSHQQQAWQALCEVWKKFGFLWPQKIMLGHRRHVKRIYKVTTDSDEQQYLYANANDEANDQMMKELTSRHTEGHQAWDIIKRSDICPLHDLLAKEQRDIIIELIALFVHRIPMHHPIKLRSLCTSGYLCWRQYAEKGNKSSATTTRFATVPVHSMQASRSSYLWQLEWSALNSPRHQQLKARYDPAYVRCGSQVYVYPVTEMHRSPSAVTQSVEMALTRVSVPKMVSPVRKSQQMAERVRGLELVDVADDYTGEHQWTIEMQGLGLEYDDGILTDMGKNVDVEIGRRKPVVSGDVISLRQIHYLCSPSNPDVPLGTWRPAPPLPPSIASSALPSSDVSPLSYSSTSMPSDISSPPQSSTANTSSSTNPGSPSKFTFLPRFTNTPPREHMHSVITKEVNMVLPRISAEQPVTLKKRYTGEQLWTIERATREDLEYHHVNAETSPATSPLSNNNILRNKKGVQDLRSANGQHHQKNKSSDDLHLSREPPKRDAVQEIKAIIKESHSPGESSSSAVRRVQSLHDFGRYGLERQTTMDEAEMPGSLSFQPATGNHTQAPPADDLDVCASARAEQFIRLYANRKNRKTFSRLLRAGTFSGFKSGR